MFGKNGVDKRLKKLFMNRPNILQIIAYTSWHKRNISFVVMGTTIVPTLAILCSSKKEFKTFPCKYIYNYC